MKKISRSVFMMGRLLSLFSSHEQNTTSALGSVGIGSTSPETEPGFTGNQTEQPEDIIPSSWNLIWNL